MESPHLDREMEPALVEPNLQAALEADEDVRIRALAAEAILAVTPRRLVVVDTRRVNLAIPFEGVRRIQFDIERSRPATLVIVPERAQEHPQVLAFFPDQYRAAADALVALGLALAAIDPAAQAENEANLA